MGRVEQAAPGFRACDSRSGRRAVALRHPAAHRTGGGRKDILQSRRAGRARRLICRSRSIGRQRDAAFAGPPQEIAAAAAGLGPVQTRAASSRSTASSDRSPSSPSSDQGPPRHCLGFVRAYDDPRLQLSGWFCQGGADFVERSTLACALDRLTLLSAGERAEGRRFVRAKPNCIAASAASTIRSLRRRRSISCCGRRLATRPEPRRIGR